FITGNADMHLKNFSLIETASGHVLSPAYDLVSTMLAIQDDPEETALALNGKKARLKLSDFEQLAMKLEVNELAWQRLVHRYQSVSKDTLARICQESFLSPTKKTELQKIIEERMGRLFG
ncbi:MAG TPA: HipA domain-containing protein, partial [Spirochaetota bacterium]|nr:HipA domain-containing protein [Spirochaetota bacterium]